MIIHSQGLNSPLRTAVGRDIKGKISPVLYLVGCVAALAGGAGTGPARPGIWIAVACYVAVARLWVVPDRRIESILPQPPRHSARLTQDGAPPPQDTAQDSTER
jgi:hypothetical protein